MRWIKTYESHGDKLELYRKLVDTLQGEIFDDYNIPHYDIMADESIIDDEFEVPEDFKYYEIYNRLGKVGPIYIYGLDEETRDSIENELKEIRPVIRGRLGVEYRVTHLTDSASDRPYWYIVISIL